MEWGDNCYMSRPVRVLMIALVLAALDVNQAYTLDFLNKIYE